MNAWYKLHPEKSKEVRREEKRKRRDRMLAFLNAYKQEHGCKHCGETNPIVLTFHHRNAKEKIFGIALKLDYSLERIKAEIEKCDVLCANCHLLEEARLRE